MVLDLGFEIDEIISPTHAVQVASYSGQRHVVTLKKETLPADGDFVLEWRPKRVSEPQITVYSQELDGDRYLLLMISPPPIEAMDPTPRETILVVDTSGSMQSSLAAAKRSLLFALDRLRPDDRFNVLRFSTSVDSLFSESSEVSPSSLGQARDYVRALQVDGGTELIRAFEAALGMSAPPGHLRQIVFVTDGHANQEALLIDRIEELLGPSRLFLVGIGSAPNASLMSRAARIGRGTYTFIDGSDQVESTMIDLFRKIESLLDLAALDPLGNQDHLREHVTELGLRHSLITPYTSLLAVSDAITAPAGESLPWTAPLASPRSFMDPGAIESVITVTSESPWMDSRQISVGCTISSTELEHVPGSHDPWTILQRVPGVLVDRVNVGGSELGRQADFVSSGSPGSQAGWSVDGISSNDAVDRGKTIARIPLFALEELEITTGGTDLSIPGASHLNMVTRRGTNRWRAEAAVEGSSGSSDRDAPLPPAARAAGGLWNAGFEQPASSGDRLAKLESGYLHGGGPILFDRLWIWAGASQDEVVATRLGGDAELRRVRNQIGKLNTQLSASNSARLFYHHLDEDFEAMDVGPTRSPSSAWTRRAKNDFLVVEDTHIIGASLFLTGTFSWARSDFEHEARPSHAAVRDQAGRWRHSYLSTGGSQSSRGLDFYGNYFFNLGNTARELRSKPCRARPPDPRGSSGLHRSLPLARRRRSRARGKRSVRPFRPANLAPGF